MLNDYTITGNVVNIHCYMKDEKYIVKVDLEDFDKVNSVTKNWRMTSDGYVRCSIDGKNVLLHRFLLDVPKGKVVDHINRDRKDNRRDNLRIVTQRENVWNTDSVGESGERCIRIRGNKFTVRFENGKNVRTKNYNTMDEAITARDNYLKEISS